MAPPESAGGARAAGAPAGAAFPPANTPAGPVTTTVPGWLESGVLLLALMVLAWAWRARIIGPRAPERFNLRDVSFRPPLIWFAAAMLAFLFVALAGALALVATAPFAQPPDSPRAVAAPMLLAYALSAPCCWGLVLALRRPTASGPSRPPAWLALHPAGVLHGVFWLVGAAPVVLAVGFLATWATTAITGTPPDPVAHDTLARMVKNRSDPWVWGLIAGAAIGAPLVEELIYRTFLQTAFLAATRRAWLAIAITSILFALVHATAVPPHAVVTLLAFGACLGLAYERTKSLMVPITMHALFNAGNIAVALLTQP